MDRKGLNLTQEAKGIVIKVDAKEGVQVVQVHSPILQGLVEDAIDGH